MREVTNSTVGKKQKQKRDRSKTQGEGHLNKEQKTDSNINFGSISKRNTLKIAAAVIKLGKKEEKETSKFDKGTEKISTLLVNFSMSAQVRGIEGEVTPSDGADKRKEKMTEIAVVLKSFMRSNKCGK